MAMNRILVTTLLLISLGWVACGGPSPPPLPMFVEMPESIEVALLEQRVAALRADLRALALDDPRRPQTIVDLARDQELLIYARTQTGATSSPLVDAPEPDYAPVIALYLQVLTEHPGAADSVKAALLEGGQLALEVGRTAEGEALLNRAIDEYPGTDESHTACLVLGDRSFTDSRLVDAKNYLSCAAESDNLATRDNARYMLGWIALNLQQFEEAYELFDGLATSSSSAELAAAAERDLLIVLAYLEGGAARAITRSGDRPELLATLLSLYLDLAHPEFPSLADHLLTTYPDHADVESWCALASSYAELIGRPLDYEACAGD